MASMCVLGLVAYVPSVWLAAASGLWSIVVVDTLAYGWVVTVTVWPGASYYLRAASIGVISYVLGVVLLTTIGLPGSGVLTAINDSRDAARYLATGADSLDLLVTDRAMPGLDGLALARQARDVSATLPILVATGFLDEATYTAVQALGRAAVITKPYRAADLAAAVEAITTAS